MKMRRQSSWRWAWLLLLSALARPRANAVVLEIPALGPGAVAAASAGGAVSAAGSLQTAALLWKGAALPTVDPAAWTRLQANNAAAVHASSVLVERLAENGYRQELAAVLTPLGDGPALAGKLEILARENVALGPARAAEARSAVAEIAPQALTRAPAAATTQAPRSAQTARTPQASLSALHEELRGLSPDDALGAREALERAFTSARRGAPETSASVVAASDREAHGAALARPSEDRPLAHEPSIPPPPASAAEPSHKKALRLHDLVGLGVNSIIGAGIFIKPALLAKQAAGSSIFAFPITALLLIPVGLAFAEAATYFPGKSGGSYRYVRGAFGDRGLAGKVGEWGSFGVTWLAWIALICGWASVTSVSAVNLSYFFPALASGWASKALASAVIAAIAYINFRGVKEGARVSNAFAVAKLLPMLLFIALGLPMLHAAAFGTLMPQSLGALSGACFLTFFALQGFENISVPAGEVHEPGKNVPRAIILSMLIASLIYTGIQLVAYGVTPSLASATKPLVDAGFRIFGAVGAAVMALCAFFSTTGDSAAAALFGARFIKVLADDKHVPGSALLSRMHPRFGTPYVAILLTSALTMLALFLPIDRLMDISSVAVSAQYIGTCLALPFLRRRMSAPAGSFRLPGGLLLPLIGALAAMGLSYAGGFGSITVDLAFLGLGLALKAATVAFRAFKKAG